ncbi:MAG: protein kinase, partial [Planctomycetes bacterium]|nr:protein kinase [Planctomycetota bacterium]
MNERDPDPQPTHSPSAAEPATAAAPSPPGTASTIAATDAGTVNASPSSGGVAATDPEPTQGARVGRYRLLRELGRGGMGVVYEAEDAALGRRVALKLLRGAAAPEIARFEREAHTAAALVHPNVAAVHEVGCDRGVHFIAMQLVVGRTLAALPPGDRERAVRLVRDAARAVHYAHTRGVIHRDLKPHNLMVDESDRVYVMDFGLARSSAVPSRLSVSGAIFGTPAYMPPEQAEGRADAVGPASDVYGLGATLYELLTGRPPFDGADALAVLRRVVEEEPRPPRTLAPHVDRDLETIVLTCLAKEPARRYATAAALADDLERWLAREPIAARRAGMWRTAWMRVRRRPREAAAIAFVCLWVGFLSSGWLGARRKMAVQNAEATDAVELLNLRMRSYRADWRLADEDLAEFARLIDRCRARLEWGGATARGWWLIGRARQALGEWTEAEAGFDAGLGVNPGDGPCLVSKARVLLDRALWDRYAWPLGRGRKLHVEGLIGEARRLILLARSSPASTGVEVELEADLAEAYELAVRGRPAEEFCRSRLARYARADFREEFFAAQGLAPDARGTGALDEALRLRPGFLEGYLYRGMRRQDGGDLEGAAADFARALEIHPRSVQAWILAGALRRERKDLARAEEDLTRALAINARLPEAWCHRAAIRAARGDAEGTAGAISDYGEVLLRDPDYEMGWYERG